MTSKRCGRCGETKPLTEFWAGSTKSGQSHHSYCKPCISQYRKEWRVANPEKAKRGERRRATKDRRTLRQQMLDAYGRVCLCCGETEERFLTLDHRDNDGHIERSDLGGNHQNLRALRNLGWPRDRYRVLCFNCNCGRAHNSGVCPHEKYALEEAS